MPLTAGQRLGQYEILAELGRGGMGEVYRARDTKLNRDVALKVLPDLMAGDPDRLARFRREAQVLASLNHPNIAHLYGFEEAKKTSGVFSGAAGSEKTPDVFSVHALVMELVEGPTLADRIAEGPMALADAVPIASQIADALEAAHEQGIVHRDLKPANVKVRPDGTVKVLDFGLAKALDAGPGTQDASTSPTLTARATQMGMIIGTAAYMAPEQARGRVVDRRADVWAFGVVLYEMLTGRRAFEGDDISITLASVLKEHVSWDALPAALPVPVRRLLRRCLEKDPKKRLSSIADARLELEEASSPDQHDGASGLVPGAATGVSSHQSRRSLTTWIAITAAVAMVAAAGAWWLKPAPLVQNQITRSSYPLAEGQSFSRTGRHLIAISPDGSKIAFVANSQLYLRSIDQLEAQPIRGSDEDPLNPVFSPDGEWIAYFSARDSMALKKIAVSGGASLTLCPAGAPWGVSWQPGLIAFGQVSDTVVGIQAVADSGGTPWTLVKVDASKERAVQPQLLDDGRHVVFTLMQTNTSGDEGQIVIQRIDGGGRTVLLTGGTHGQILPTGHLVYIHNSTLLAVPFDAKRLAVVGGPVPVVEGVRETNTTFAGQFAISRTGTLAFVPGSYAFGENTLVWVDRKGIEQPLLARPRAYAYPRISPDGTRIVVASQDEEGDLWIWDIAKETPTRLTFGPARELYGQWTNDSRQVVFGSSNSVTTDIFRKLADNTGPTEPVTKDGTGGDPNAMSGDGKAVVFRNNNLVDLMLVAVDGGSAPQPLLANPKFTETNSAISPDGRWIAYEANEWGARTDVFVRPFPDVNSGRWQVSSEGGNWPVWSRSGRELFFATPGTFRMWSVAVEPGAAFSYGKPQPVWDMTPYQAAAGRNWDVAKDGRFLMVKQTATGKPSVTVVTHWFEELRAKVK